MAPPILFFFKKIMKSARKIFFDQQSSSFYFASIVNWGNKILMSLLTPSSLQRKDKISTQSFLKQQIREIRKDFQRFSKDFERFFKGNKYLESELKIQDSCICQNINGTKKQSHLGEDICKLYFHLSYDHKFEK